MLEKGPAKKLVIYVNEGQRHRGEPVYEAVVRFL
jgi:PII-like signaling protein